MVTQTHKMLCRVGFLSLIVNLFGMVPSAQAQSKLPDLMPVVIDANKGLVEVRNVGGATAAASQVFIVCSRVPPKSKRIERCAAGLHLPGFIKKWNILPYDIPALQPGGKYLLHLFGSGAFQRRPGLNAMAITTDPLKQITESSESNNYTRLDTVIKMAASSGSKPVGKAADLVPVIINADQGIVQVRNQGTLTRRYRNQKPQGKRR